jgi:hypothetical protein
MSERRLALLKYAWPVAFVCVGLYTIWTGVVGYRLMRADIDVPRWVDPPLYEQIAFGCVWLLGGAIQLVRSVRSSDSSPL